MCICVYVYAVPDLGGQGGQMPIFIGAHKLCKNNSL